MLVTLSIFPRTLAHLVSNVSSALCTIVHAEYVVKYTHTIKQGFWYSGLCMAFSQISCRHYGCSVKKHIEEGIYLPAMDGFVSQNMSVHVHNLCV